MLNQPSGVQFLLDHNAAQSADFTNPKEVERRQSYVHQHPTSFHVLKCMDGRCDMAQVTETPAGTITPWRNLGGMFHLGWPTFQQQLLRALKVAKQEEMPVAIIVTYHFSASQPHLGCKGWGYDTEAAKAYTQKFQAKATTFFNNGVPVIVMGLETDRQALLVEGWNGETLDIRESLGLSEQELATKLTTMFPGCDPRVLRDLVPLLAGNSRHVTEVQNQQLTPEDVDHQEWTLAIGRGFDWLHLYNVAIIIGPFDVDISKPLRIGAGLLAENVTSGRVDPNKHGLVVMSASPTWRRQGTTDWSGAETKAAFFAAKTMRLIQEEYKEIAEYAYPLVGVVDMHTRLFHRQEFDSEADQL